MKTLLCALILVCLTSITFGSSVWCEIEITKENFLTVEQGEQLKLIFPKYSEWINSYIVALKQGMTASYNVDIWLDQDDDPIRSAYVVKPNAAIVTLQKNGPDSFNSDVTHGPSKFYTSIADLQTEWPSGDYVLYVTFADGHTQTWTTTVPDYNTTPFPDIVSGSLSTDAQGQLQLDWNTVSGVSEYEIWAVELKKSIDVYESGNLYLYGLQSQTTSMDGAYAGKGDYNIGVLAENDVTSGEFGLEFNTQANWFSFKNAPALKQNIVTKSTVAAGKSGGIGSISFSGTLDAIEADFTLAMGDVVEVFIDSDLMTAIAFQFPINTTTLKKGKFSSKIANASFALDTKTGKMAFSAKNVNLTGLECPIYVSIIIGNDYKTKLELTEAIVNGTKLCPFQLKQGVENSLDVIKHSFKKGNAPGKDSLTVSGTFTVAGGYTTSRPLVITLGTQTFTVPGDKFTGKNSVDSCKATLAEGLVTAKLDYNKCTFTISIKNATINQSDDVAFGISCFDVSLEGFETLSLN